MGSNPIWGSEFFCVLLWLILYISPYFPLYINITGIIILTLEIMWYRVWKGTCIFGIRDLTKIQWEWEHAKYLDQKQKLTAMQEVGLTKNIIWAWDVGVFCQSIRNLGAKKVSRKIQREREKKPSSLSLFLSSTFSPMLQHSEVSRRLLNFCMR